MASNVGATGNTGGSASAGTIMAKLNKIVSDISTLVSNWTSTRAGYIDTIKTNTDNIYAKVDTEVAGVVSNTATNNTANKTGVLSAKLAYVISLLENTTYGLSALKTAASSSGWYAKYGSTDTIASNTTTQSTVVSTTGSSSATLTVLTFDVPVSGVYQWSVSGVSGGFSSSSAGGTHDMNYSPSIGVKVVSSVTGGTHSIPSSLASTSISISPSSYTNKSASGYVYLQQGFRVTIQLTISTSDSNFYEWIKCNGAYIKCIKQTI